MRKGREGKIKEDEERGGERRRAEEERGRAMRKEGK